VAHLVHGVVAHVAVQSPVAGALATNSTPRVAPTVTSTVFASVTALSADPLARRFRRMVKLLPCRCIG